ncbi:MAG: putative addiction module antidote protein [Enterobacterales bacterium]|nr:putative addiction module antidote protein [Enterobacterales bacterium]
MTITTTNWDSAEYLKTDEDIQLYLDACLEEANDDPSFILHALGIIARAKNMSQLARDTGLTREGLYKALSSDGNPSFSTVAKVTQALGFRLTVEQSSTPAH